MIKSPKVYFYDVGLAAYLMGIDSSSQILTHPLRGMLFENLIVNEVMKFFMHRGRHPNLLFYRDSNGNEVDLVIPHGAGFIPIEIKSAETVASGFFKGFGKFNDAVPGSEQGILVYGGDKVRVQNAVYVTNLSGLSEHLCQRLQM